MHMYFQATSPPVFEGCPPICYMLCPYGNERDENGCEICLCRERKYIEKVSYLSKQR